MSRMTVAAAVLVVTAAVLSGVPACRAAERMTKAEALEAVLGKDMEITVEVRTPTAEELATIEEALERPLFTEEDKLMWGCPVNLEEESESAEAPEAAPEAEAPAKTAEPSEEQTSAAAEVVAEGEAEATETPEGIEFFFGSKDGERQDVAVFVQAPGKWGPVGYAVGMNLDGVVRRVEVVESQEKRGKDIERRSFMKQFEGKSSENKLEVSEDIMAVSGATVTSRSACDAVMKAAVLYAEFYLKPAESKEPASKAD